MLSTFCLEVKQQSGDPYTPKLLLQILTNLQNYARSIDSGSFMCLKNPRFKRLHTVLDNITCKLHKEGVGTSKIQACTKTAAEEQQLWESGVIGTSTPSALLNSVFFYCGIHLCLRGGSEHRSLKVSQFTIKQVGNPSASDEFIKCLIYTEHGSKNRSGSVHQVHLQNKVIHFANSSLGERCFVHMIKPLKAIEKDHFYCRSTVHFDDDKPWYYDSPAGHTLLGRKLMRCLLVLGSILKVYRITVYALQVCRECTTRISLIK